MSPGLQREMIIAAVSDPEVFGILADKVDLVRPVAPDPDSSLSDW